jgi:hypothetical protein
MFVFLLCMFVFYFIYSVFLFFLCIVSPVVYKCLLFLYMGWKPIAVNQKVKVKGTAIPLQAWTGPEGSGRLRISRQ